MGGGPRAWCQKSAAGFILKTGRWMSTGCWMSADMGLSSPPGEARRSSGVDIVVDTVLTLAEEIQGLTLTLYCICDRAQSIGT